MLAKKWRLACWAPLLGLLAPCAGANEQALALEKFDVADLTVWITSTSARWGTYAYILGPDGYAYRVGLGDRMGKHDGKITKIARCRIYFTDLMSDGTGGYVEVPRSLGSTDPSGNCLSTKRLATDVVRRTGLPPEVAKKIESQHLSTIAFLKETDNDQLTVWIGVAASHGFFDRDSKVEKLIVFHKSSKAVDIISGF